MQTIKQNAGFLFFLGAVILGTWLTSDKTGGLSFDAVFGSQISDRADDRDDIDAIYKRAREFDANGEFEKAVIQYTDIIERYPNDANAHYNRCRAYYHMGKLEHAITDCTTAIEINPEYIGALAIRCYSLEQSEAYDEAIENCTHVITLDSGHSGAYTARADAYRELGDLDLALADYDRSLEIDPKDSTTYNNRALLHRDMDNDDLALADYNSAIETYDPLNDYWIHVTWHNRGLIYADMDEYDKAIFDYRTAIDIYPSYIRAIMSLASIFYTLERYPQSLELYETVIRLEDSGIKETQWDTSYIPDTIDYLREQIELRETALGEHIGLLYAGREAQIREDYTTAIESYTELIDLVPDYYDVRYWRAQSLEEVELYTDALKDYQAYYDNASETDEFYYSASYRIDDLNLMVKYDPEAVKLYQEARDIQYEDPEKARDLYTQAVTIEPTFTQIYQERAYLNRYSLNDWEAALADYQSYAEVTEKPNSYRYAILTLQEMIALPDEAQACLREIEEYYYGYETDLSADDLITLYTCVIDLAPNYALAYVHRGEEYEYDYRYHEAVADYEKYLNLVADNEALSTIYDALDDEDFYADYDDYGYYEDDIYYYSPDYIEVSLETLYRYVELPTETLEQWQSARRAYYLDSENLVAISYLSQVIEAQPDFADALALRGRIYYDDVDYENALSDLQTYIALVDDEDISYYEQTLVTEIETLFALPSDVQDLYQQAMIEVNNYEYQAAIDIYTEVIETYPDVVDAYYQRAELYQYESEYTLALADLNHYISLAGDDNPHASELEWKLEYLNNLTEYDSENSD